MLNSCSKSILVDIARQYSENENKRQSITISFIATLIIIITTMGYSLKDFLKESSIDNIFLLTVSSILSVAILTIIIVFSIFYSYSLRRDQIVVDKIRYCFLNKDEDNYYEHFFKNYKPNLSIQDFYLIIISSAIIFQLFIVLLFTISLLMKSCHNINCIIIILHIILNILFFIFTIVVTMCAYCHYKKKLKPMLEELEKFKSKTQ